MLVLCTTKSQTKDLNPDRWLQGTDCTHFLNAHRIKAKNIKINHDTFERWGFFCRLNAAWMRDKCIEGFSSMCSAARRTEFRRENNEVALHCRRLSGLSGCQAVVMNCLGCDAKRLLSIKHRVQLRWRMYAKEIGHQDTLVALKFTVRETGSACQLFSFMFLTGL